MPPSSTSAATVTLADTLKSKADSAVTVPARSASISTPDRDGHRGRSSADREPPRATASASTFEANANRRDRLHPCFRSRPAQPAERRAGGGAPPPVGGTRPLVGYGNCLSLVIMAQSPNRRNYSRSFIDAKHPQNEQQRTNFRKHYGLKLVAKTLNFVSAYIHQ